MAENVVLEKAKFSYELFKSEANGYCTFIYKIPEGKVTCTGTNLPDNKGLTFSLNGQWFNHPKYGRQFKVDSYQTIIENTKEGIIAYISSGIIKGIGEKTAQKIYATFKDESLNVLNNEPEKLLTVKGITKKKLDIIVKSYKHNQILEDTMLFFSPFGITSKMAAKIYNVYKDETLLKVKENPYDLCNIKGLKFEDIDGIGISLKFNEMDERRVFAAIQSVLQDNAMCGSVGITKEELLYGRSGMLEGLISKLKVSKQYSDLLWSKIINFIKTEKLSYSKQLIDGKVVQYIYEPSTKKIETELTDFILEHINRNKIAKDKILRLIKENSGDIELDDSQKNAVINAFQNDFSIITGGPGTGKTTIIKIIEQIAKILEPDMQVLFMAPTGKAARRITESTGASASTIHSALGLGIHDNDVSEYEEDIEPIYAGTLIVDEFSMVDMALAHKLMGNIDNSRIVLVGDKDQLASVGAGNVLKDMIESNVIPVSFLTYTHRQGKNSMICENAANIQKDVDKLIESDEFECDYINSYQPMEDYLHEVQEHMIKAYLRDVERYGIKNVVCLCPYKKYTTGVFETNAKIQNVLNPLNGRVEFKGTSGMVFRVNDPVIQLKNKDTVLNGDVGNVTYIGKQDDEFSVVVSFENGSVETYARDNIDEIMLAYAMTIHKSQGSEYDSVVMCLTSFNKRMMKRNVLYTGITRAKKHVTLISNESVICETIHNNSVEERHTLLKNNLSKHKKDNFTQLTLKTG